VGSNECGGEKIRAASSRCVCGFGDSTITSRQKEKTNKGKTGARRERICYKKVSGRKIERWESKVDEFISLESDAAMRSRGEHPKTRNAPLKIHR